MIHQFRNEKLFLRCGVQLILRRGCRLVVPGVSNTHLTHMTGRKRWPRALKHHAP